MKALSPLHVNDSGWRDVIADGFTASRLSAVVKAFARLNKNSPKILVGFDNRFFSREFAHHVAFVLEKEGLKPIVLTDVFPTPGVGVWVKRHSYDWGLMITASHNPYYYNGLKILDRHGGLIGRDLADAIERLANKILIDEPSPKFSVKERFSPEMDDQEARDVYFGDLLGRVDVGTIRKANLTAAWDAFGGAADRLFSDFLKSLGVRGERFPTPIEPTFGGRRLEPDETSLKGLGALVVEKKMGVGLATDVDGDRFSAVDEKGAYVLNNAMGSLMVWYLLACRKEKGAVYQTVSCSSMTRRICDDFGVAMETAPVGFLAMGRKMIEDSQPLIGIEETGGLAYAPHLPFKDGLMAHALVLEMLATQRKTLTQLLDAMRAAYGTFHYRRVDLKLPSDEEVERRLHPTLWERAVGEAVSETSTLDGVKWLFPSGWILIRRSKTEPLLRIYAESEDESFVERMKKAAI